MHPLQSILVSMRVNLLTAEQKSVILYLHELKFTNYIIEAIRVACKTFAKSKLEYLRRWLDWAVKLSLSLKKIKTLKKDTMKTSSKPPQGKRFLE